MHTPVKKKGVLHDGSTAHRSESAGIISDFEGALSTIAGIRMPHHEGKLDTHALRRLVRAVMIH